MKNYMLLFFFTLSLYAVHAQEFKETTKYIAKNESSTKQQEYSSIQILMTAMGDTSERVATVTISDSDLFEELRITVLTNPELKDIHEVVKVELEYSACCAYAETYYFLASENGDFISLPKIVNTHCEIPQFSEQYIFPAQANGLEETILRTKLHYTENYTIKGIEVLQSYAWNDDDFDSEEAVTAIQ